MSKNTLVIIVIVVIAYVYISKTNTPVDVVPMEQLVQHDAKAPENAKPWPFLDESGQTALSDNMLITNIYVVFDGSGSMGGTACSGGLSKIEAAKKALNSFVSYVPDRANLGLSAFDRNGIHERAALGVNNREHFTSAIGQISIGGQTPLNTAINGAYAKLTEQARQQLGYGEYHLVVITDGEASNGYEPDKVVEKLISESPVVVHTIGFCIDNDHSLNQPGRTIYKTATDYESLKRGLQGVLAEAPEFSVSDFN